MVQGRDESFDAALFVGYHAAACDPGNPLSHTLSSRKLHSITLNGRPLSELAIHAWVAATLGVPVVMVTGDEAICAEAEKRLSGVTTAAVKSGEGASTTSLHPSDAVDVVRAAAERAVGGAGEVAPAELPPDWRLEVTYGDLAMAYVRSFYPGGRAS